MKLYYLLGLVLLTNVNCDGDILQINNDIAHIANPTTIEPPPAKNDTPITIKPDPPKPTPAPKPTLVPTKSTSPPAPPAPTAANVTTTAPAPTIAPTNASTPVPSTSLPPNPHNRDRTFDGPSFIGGIVLACGLTSIGFVAFKFYKARTERNYHTL